MKVRYVYLVGLLILTLTTSAQGFWPEQPTIFELTLGSAIARALQISPALDLARLEVEKAELELRSTQRMADTIGEVSTYQLAVLKYLYPERSRLALALAECQVQAVQENVSLQVRAAYLGALLAREMVNVAEEAVTTARDQVRLAERLQTSGMVPQKDVMDARVREAQARAGLITAEKNLTLAMMGLSRVIGLPLEAELQLEPGVPLLDVTAYPLYEQLASGLESRYEMKRSRHLVILADMNLSLAEIYPAGANWPDWPDEWPDDISLPPWFSWPGNDDEEVDDELSEITLRQAEIDYQQAVIYQLLTDDEIAYQIRKTYLEVEESSLRLAVHEEGLQAAEEGLRMARLRYQAGVGTNLEMLAAALARSQAHTALVAALFEHELAKATYLHTGSAGSRGNAEGPGR